MEMSPLVSVLIPMFNAEKYILPTLESVLAQTYPNIEVIVVDDGSSDNSYEIAAGFNAGSAKVLRGTRQGACVARNIAFEQASGKYIQFLDADDLLSPKKIEKQVIALNNQDDHVSHSGWVFFKGVPDKNMLLPKAALYRDFENPIDFLIDSMMGKGIQPTSTWLIPRQLIQEAGNWNPVLQKNQDGEFLTRILLKSKRIVYARDEITYYRKENPDSVSSKLSLEKLNSQLESFDLIAKHMLAREPSNRVKKAIKSQYVGFLYHYFPLFPELYVRVEERMKRFVPGISYVGPNKKFQLLVSLFGLQSALRIIASSR